MKSDSELSDYSSTDEEAQEADLRKLKEVLEKERFPLTATSTSLPSRFELGPSTSSEPCTALEDIRNVRKALALNKLVQEKVTRLEKVMYERLKECRRRLSNIRSSNQTSATDNNKPSIFRYVFCGKPYFRDRDNFPAPDNDDTIAIERLGLYDYSNVTCLAGWTVKDKSDFLKQIQKFSQQIRKERLESKLAELKRIARRKDSKQIQQEIISIRKEINMVHKLPLDEDLVLPLDEEYDWEAIANALNYRHSAEEYRNLWKLFLHPKINKKSWDKWEHARLRDVAMANQLQDWDKIAMELNTGRTGYQCFVYYRTNMGTSPTGQKWTKEEEEYLRRLIDYYREDNYIPWGKVSACMEFRTKIQIYNKFTRLMEIRKGRFLPEEDTVLLTGVTKFGPNFRQIAKYIPGRSAAQLRTRYNVLRSTATRTSVVWTVEEDRKLIQLIANQDSTMYVNYAKVRKHFPDKDRSQIRARYVTLVKWMKKHPNRDISKAPRRGARRLTHGRTEGDMTMAIDKLKKRIKNEVETKKAKKLTKQSSEDVIDDTIVAALITEAVKEEEMKNLGPECLFADKDDPVPCNGKINEVNLRKLLILLKAKLNKQLFETSPFSLQYPKIKQADTESFCVKVKSYSKKAATTIITASGTINPPDIWGNNRLTTSGYVLPPNYSTITGCRRLMAFASNKNHQNNRNSLHQYTNRNVIVKEQVHLFMERFNTLFLWPMLLSNEPPKENTGESVRFRIEKHVKRREQLLTPVSVAIPSKLSDMVNETIDLPSTSTAIAQDTIIKPKVGNDDFMYINDEEFEEMDDKENDMIVTAETLKNYNKVRNNSKMNNGKRNSKKRKNDSENETEDSDEYESEDSEDTENESEQTDNSDTEDDDP